MDINYQEIRKIYPQNIIVEVNLRLARVKRARDLFRKDFRKNPEEYAWFELLTLIEWLCRWDRRKKLNQELSQEELSLWISKKFNWEEDIAKCFIAAIRNPLMHTGFINSFCHYEDALYKGKQVRVPYTSNKFSENHEPIVLPDPFEDNGLQITFSLDTIIEKISAIANKVVSTISQLDGAGTRKLYEINKVMPFRATATENIATTDDQSNNDKLVD